jgi:hypothetical protein
MAVLSNGLIGGALFFLLLKQGIGAGHASAIVAFLNLPQILYFLWSPITDFWMRRRSWLIVASVAAAAVIVAAFHQSNLASPGAVALIFLSACFVQLVVSSCGGLMGTLHSEKLRRSASGFYQSGSLAFGALALAVLVALANRLQLGALGWVMAAMIALPSLTALAEPEQRAMGEHSLKETFHRIGDEFAATFFRWEAIPYTLVILFPMASGALIQLLTGLAHSYGISDDQAAWINGLGGALLTAAGALSATLVPTRIRATVAYPAAGLVNAAVVSLLWLGPLKPMVYFVGTMLFMFTIGAGYALSRAVVLEFMGNSGKSGSTRYSILNSLLNVPLVYMVWLDGKCAGLWGSRAASGADAVVSAVGATILLAYFLSRRRPSNPQPNN